MHLRTTVESLYGLVDWNDVDGIFNNFKYFSWRFEEVGLQKYNPFTTKLFLLPPEELLGEKAPFEVDISKHLKKFFVKSNVKSISKKKLFASRNVFMNFFSWNMNYEIMTALPDLSETFEKLSKKYSFAFSLFPSKPLVGRAKG